MTDSDDGMLSMDDDYPDDSDMEENEMEEEEDEDVMVIEPDVSTVQGPKVVEEEYRYEILTGDQVVEFMQEIIRDVNSVVQVGLSEIPGVNSALHSSTFCRPRHRLCMRPITYIKYNYNCHA